MLCLCLEKPAFLNTAFVKNCLFFLVVTTLQGIGREYWLRFVNLVLPATLA